jgi:hypothetical protein
MTNEGATEELHSHIVRGDRHRQMWIGSLEAMSVQDGVISIEVANNFVRGSIKPFQS